MTMLAPVAPLALEDVEALCFEPSFLLADPMGPLVDPDEEEEEALSPSSSLEGGAPPAWPPPLCLSPYQTSPPPPPSSSSSLLETKDPGTDPLSWLDAGSLLLPAHGGHDGSDDSFDMDWMTEKMDLSQFDLDSLIGSCSSDAPPSSPQELLASPHRQMDRAPEPYGSGGPASPPFPAPPPPEALKSEPPSPPPPVYLEIRSDVDLLDKVSTTVTATIVQDPASGRVLLLVANQEEPAPPASPGPPSASPGPGTPPPSGDSDSGDSGIDSPACSPPRPPSPPPAGSSRTKPYARPGPPAPPRAAPKVKVVEKKLKKMEQNKTAATRYRQKKRVEQELLSSQCEELEKKNQELEDQAQSISREIQYLRDLMDEVKKRRGRSGPTAPTPAQ